LGATAAADEVSAMRSLRSWFLLSTLILVAPASYSQVNASVTAVNEGPTTPNVKTFDLREGFLIVVDGRIGPLEHLKFILDTGASYTVVSRKIADLLALPRQAGSVVNFQSKLPMEWARVPEVQVGPIVATDAQMMVADLGRYSEFAKDVDAIAGLDLLSRCERVQIDYQAKRIAFHMWHDASQAPRLPTMGVVVMVSLHDRPVPLLVDTGFQQIVLFEERLRAGGRTFRVEKIKQERIGPLVGEAVRMPGLRIGSDGWNEPVLLVRGTTDAVPHGLDGYLGPRALGAKKIELDFGSMMLRWQ
jgi:predicted aspartyl protease